jgi:hypothetical protein
MLRGRTGRRARNRRQIAFGKVLSRGSGVRPQLSMGYAFESATVEARVEIGRPRTKGLLVQREKVER